MQEIASYNLSLGSICPLIARVRGLIDELTCALPHACYCFSEWVYSKLRSAVWQRDVIDLILFLWSADNYCKYSSFSLNKQNPILSSKLEYM
jgi:hypothetical protein